MTRRPKILVVDDEPNALAALGELLRDAGYEVATAASDADAAVELTTFRPDIVLKEVHAPGIAHGRLEWTLVDGEPPPQQLLMSGAVPALELDAPFIQKPLDFDALLAVLAQLRRR